MRALLCGMLVGAACAASSAGAAGSGDGVRYLPDIFGRLAGVHRDVPTNVCLRRAGSQITQCAYTDSEGRFRLPSFGEIHPLHPGDPDWHGSEYPEHWLEIGTRSKVERRLWTVELVERKHVAIRIDCDPARASNDGAPPVYCERRDAP